MQASITTQSVPNTNQQFPGQYKCTLFKDGTQISSQLNANPGPFSFILTNPVPVGLYTAQAQRLNVAGSPISDPATSAPLVVSAPDSFDAPVTITLSL
jgi:hypothetical protein